MEESHNGRKILKWMLAQLHFAQCMLRCFAGFMLAFSPDTPFLLAQSLQSNAALHTYICIHILIQKHDPCHIHQHKRTHSYPSPSLRMITKCSTLAGSNIGCHIDMIQRSQCNRTPGAAVFQYKKKTRTEVQTPLGASHAPSIQCKCERI